MNLIASALGIPAEATTSLETIQSYIADLQGKSRPQKLCRHQVIYRVKEKETNDRLYFDQPQCLRNDGSSKMSVVGNRPVSDLSLYLAKNPEVSFIVYRDYTPPLSRNEHFLDDNLEDAHQLEHTHETLVPVTKELSNAVSSFLKQFDGSATDIKGKVTLFAPYVAVYHNRGHALESFLASLRQRQQNQLQSLLDYVVSQYSQEWALVDDMIKRRKITSEYIEYLFKPGDVVVHGRLHNVRGYLCRLWPKKTCHPKTNRGPTKTVYTINVSHWEFDKEFIQRNTQLDLTFKHSDVSEMSIADLNDRPLRLMNSTMQQMLRDRGKRIWTCRTRCLVSYHEDASREIHYTGDDRYMVDMKMYRELHKSDGIMADRPGQLEPGLMEQDEPPNNDKYAEFVYLLPPTIKAFNLKSKKWLDLKVDRIGDVVWNDEAFKSLHMWLSKRKLSS